MSAAVFRDVSSAKGGVAIDVSTADQTIIGACRGLYIGSSGDVKVDLVNSSSITFTGALAGTILTIQATKVYNSGTTASSIVAVF